ncbi:uncharacterized protein A1O5_06932 [Cladophialophora psammophila CBS 110553]|uniref:Uncharacterized protein n=1 Tax=Cladophialophora psammophila CBS 110553 TaxID=1182543 RepID=W9WXV1_9EURO|nr:uncharacterized protein A1O5_06932 [Cladophialophora psammophila CBS 110553]EXJ69860.1 hypothetical protein A1O5_06932 [Cladophialophora psammophila CBS 110553]
MSVKDVAAFEKMGIISTSELTPGPSVVETWSDNRIGTPLCTEQRTIVEGKKYLVDDKELQDLPAPKNTPLQWRECREELLRNARYPERYDEGPTVFHVVFE